MMRGSQLLVTTAAILQFTLLFVCRSSAFRPLQAYATLKRTRQLFAGGLYDDDDESEPVPRFVADSSSSKKDNSDDNDHLSTISRLFDFKEDGTEVRNLLPRLSRSLTSGVECYFEPTDRIVQNLSSKLACHPMDAAWALEVYKGDVTEAWLAISTARKNLLNKQDLQQQEEEDDFDAQLFDMLQANKELISDDEKEDFDERKERLSKEERQQAQQEAIKDAFSGGKPDQPWNPIQNPNPIDDEPWFTG